MVSPPGQFIGSSQTFGPTGGSENAIHPFPRFNNFTGCDLPAFLGAGNGELRVGRVGFGVRP